MSLSKTAWKNYEALERNTYPGRGLIIGKTPGGTHIVQMCWLMGRSDGSRNRRYVHDGNIVRIEAVDPAKVKNPAITLYNAMREDGDRYVVSNGEHTDTIFGGTEQERRSFQDSMRCWDYEPPETDYTPRIAGICERRADGLTPLVSIAILSVQLHKEGEVPPEGDDCVRSFYEYNFLPNGFGYCVHTYTEDGKPLPSFRGPPFPVPLIETNIEDMAKSYWESLDQANHVAIAVKYISVESGESEVFIINKY